MRQPNASTASAEQGRKNIAKADKNVYRTLQQKTGRVSEVHKTLPMVKVIFNDNTSAAGGNWIGVGHSVLDIVHRFGELRVGLRAMVLFSGEVEKNAIALIVGIEGEKLGAEINQENSIDSSYPW